MLNKLHHKNKTLNPKAGVRDMLLDEKCGKERGYMGQHVTKAERERSWERGVTPQCTPHDTKPLRHRESCL